MYILKESKSSLSLRNQIKYNEVEYVRTLLPEDVELVSVPLEGYRAGLRAILIARAEIEGDMRCSSLQQRLS